MLSKIEDIVIKKIEITTAKPSPIIRVTYELIDKKGNVYGSGTMPSGWSAEAIEKTGELTRQIHTALADVLFHTTKVDPDGVYGSVGDSVSKPRGLFSDDGPSSI